MQEAWEELDFLREITNYDSICFRQELEERPQDLYQHIVAFVEDDLSKKDGGITHLDEKEDSLS